MTIDVATGTGRIVRDLERRLFDEKRLERLEMLDSWCRGEQPLPDAPPAAQDAVRSFHRDCSHNWALLIAEAVRERQRVRGIKTSRDEDVTGDGEAWALWHRMRMPIVFADIARIKSRLGAAYALVSPPSPDEPDVPVVTAEDPRVCIGDPDPLRPWILRKGLKVVADPTEGVTRLYLYRPGRLDVAESKRRPGTASTAASRFSDSWSWNTDLSGDLPDGMMPLVPFEALDGAAEFEPHLRLLRQIDNLVLQQLSIAVLQAFRQRWVKGLPAQDDQGRKIDYSELFPADPASVWLLPSIGEVGESGQVDLNGILAAIQQRVRHLAATSRTPMYMFDAGGENQSAEGASVVREGIVFKVEDRNSRDEPALARVMELAYRWLGQDVTVTGVDWTPPARSSAAERASAMAQANSAGVPLRSNLRIFGELDGIEIDKVMTDLADQQLQDQIAAQAAAQQQADTQVRVEEAKAKAAAAAGAPQNGAQAPAGATNGTVASTGKGAAVATAQSGAQR